MKSLLNPTLIAYPDPTLDTESKRKRYPTQCLNKARFNSEAKAIANGTRWADSLNEDRFIYECDICGCFHVSSDMIRTHSDYPRPCAVCTPSTPKPNRIHLE